jgi:hypothetical protein
VTISWWEQAQPESKLYLNLENRYGYLSSSLLSRNHCLFISWLIQWELRSCSEDNLSKFLQLTYLPYVWATDLFLMFFSKSFPCRFSTWNVTWFPLIFRNKVDGYFLLFISTHITCYFAMNELWLVLMPTFWNPIPIGKFLLLICMCLVYIAVLMSKSNLKGTRLFPPWKLFRHLTYSLPFQNNLRLARTWTNTSYISNGSSIVSLYLGG